MKRTAKSQVQVYCVDLAKNVFQAHGFTATGERVVQQRLTRSKFDRYFAQGDGAQVVMEACGSSHYWGRLLAARGYRSKLVPASFVAKYRHGNKTDGNDADAIFAVHQDRRVKPVPIKTLAQQDACARHRLRELLVKQHTQCINQVRGLLAERGCVGARGEAGFAVLLARVRSAPPAEVTPALLTVIEVLVEQLQQIQAQLTALKHALAASLAQSPTAQRLDSIRGIGLITATALAAEYAQGVERFADSRQFAASLGCTPREHSSGQCRRLGSITRRGNPYLRRLLIQGAQAVVRVCGRHEEPLCLLARRLLAQGKRRNVVVVAIANRLARIAYAVIKHQQPYRYRQPLAA